MRKKKISMLLAVILFLSGVSTRVHAEPVTGGQEGLIQQNVEQTVPISNTSSSNNSKFVIQFANRPKTMTLERHDYIAADSADFQARQLPTVGPLYQENWRLQPISFKLGESPEAIFEYGNTGDKPITITDKDLSFSCINAEGNDVSGSKIVGGPITIQPNSIATIKLTATNPDTRSILVKIGERHMLYWLTTDSNITIINDTSPVSIRTGRDLTAATSFGVGNIVGNGKFKFQILGSKIVDNAQIGSLSKPAGGTLLLVKVRVANTSSETMKINSFALKSARWKVFSAYNWQPTNEKNINWSVTDQAILGEYGLPTEIKANSIVEGFVPAIMYDTNESISVECNTNLGQLNIKGIEALNLWAY